MPDNTPFNSLIVTFNSADEIADLLGDLQRLAPSQRVVVIDNASQDSTAEIVRTRFPEVMLRVNPQTSATPGRLIRGSICATQSLSSCSTQISAS